MRTLGLSILNVIIGLSGFSQNHFDYSSASFTVCEWENNYFYTSVDVLYETTDSLGTEIYVVTDNDAIFSFADTLSWVNEFSVWEDSIADRVWIKPAYVNVPAKVLFDFDFSIGDTLHSVLTESQNWSGGALVVKQIDTILIGGANRARITFQEQVSDSTELELIKGIGTSKGYLSLNHDYYIGEQIYFDGSEVLNTCGNISVDENALELELFPNPVQNELYIELETSSQFDCIVYDSYGREVDQYMKLNSRNDISTEKWKAGVYLVVIITDAGQIIKKVIKD